MGNRKVDYEGIIHARRFVNANQVIKDLDDEKRDIQRKVKNFANNWDLDIDEVEENLRNNTLFRYTFAKSPSKQSIHEEIASNYIESLPIVDRFENLPAGGKNAKHVGLSGVTVGAKDEGIKSKSIDFEIHSKGKVIYVGHKFTGDDGGAQDNQFNDIKEYLHEAAALKKTGLVDDSVEFMAIVDGPYYQRNGRMSILKNAGEGLTPVITIEELEDYLERL